MSKPRKPYIDENGETRELDAAFFKKGVRGRPPMPDGATKERITIRLDRDLVEHYRASGRGWQSMINSDLRKVTKLENTKKQDQ
ncbi:MAG: hypothetical protein CNE91_04045 [SAR116 cluster bacterium MED-G04]|jgi:uncharacterized protein (DUF4415 family)|nr:hypothetical protein [SAR116 cluster bacterium]OUW36706.1 MAG: hypothetical protein CBD43_04000 [Gammaproteobacteria bacterium TMED183]PDH64609.1 MAG: hypothetical protein CNE91_04045 [SAR116 cluster bacterium MED-G04]HCD49106.1 hypothetical protein [Alphaproteobacteria bacterium]CAI8411818.1 MAG: Uncharacterised protein [SAR116 cluster bacterium MED-G04]|tara:strand:- start:2321 stop:2572 length:252 start_codon:yes stop_codon:yes gene_type:complete